MKYFFWLILFFSTEGLRAQDCDCASQLSFVVQYFEENNPAFQKIKSDATAWHEYTAALQAIKKNAAAEKDIDRCIIHLDRFVALLKDHHSSVGFNLKRDIDLSTPASIEQFKSSEAYSGFEKLDLDTTVLMQHLRTRTPDEIEGIYSNGGSLVFGIVKKTAEEDKYLGVVLRSNILMDVGHVLLELERKPDESFDVIYHVGLLGYNLKKIFRNMKIANGQIPAFGFAKLATALSETKEYEFRPLNDSMNYLRLSSFSGPHTRELDSFYNAIAASIRSRPYLVVDIRNNGGGSEQFYLDLLPYAYTRPLKIDPASVWVSPENIKRYEESGQEADKELVRRMKLAKPFSFIPQQEEGTNTWALDSATAFPKKIALIFNRGSASAAEGMITYFLQSDKVITVGENSGGYIGYGNVMRAQTPCGKFTVNSTTTRYQEKSKYEFVGIEPMYPAAGKPDWIAYAVELLVQSK